MEKSTSRNLGGADGFLYLVNSKFLKSSESTVSPELMKTIFGSNFEDANISLVLPLGCTNIEICSQTKSECGMKLPACVPSYNGL